MTHLLAEIAGQILDSHAETVALALCECGSEQGLAINPDVSFHPASLVKVCIMMEVFRQAHQGFFSLEDLLTVKNEFRSIADHSSFSLAPADDSETSLYTCIGEKVAVRDLVTRMITHSSNLAANLLIEKITAGKVTDFMHKLGADGIFVRRGVEDGRAYARGLNNAATAQSLLHILGKLALHQVVSPAASQSMLEMLKQQHFNEGIPARLPADIPIAHKTGWNEKLYHDAAIIYPPGREPYALVIMTSGLDNNREAPTLVASLSQLVYDHQPEWR